MDEEREVALRGDDALLSLAITKGVDTETLEKLIAMRNAEIARRAKEDFDREFALMQAEFTPVGKTNEAQDRDGNRLYRYCPIEVILAMAAPIIARHGFAYSWSEEALESKEKRIWCIISGHGHERRGYVDIPFMEPTTRATNAVQMRGSATTYGKRYSFLNATGIIVGGEDNDALSNSAPGTVKAEVIPDEPETPDPGEAIKKQIADEISVFVTLAASEFEGKAYFTDEEKAFYKQQIAIVNEAAKAEKDVTKARELKLAEVKKLTAVLRDELDNRKGNTPLAKAMADALKASREGGEPQQELY